jgi:hypothetical protein
MFKMPALTAREAEAIADARNRVSKRRLRVQVKDEKVRAGSCEVGLTHSDSAGWTAQIKDAFGTTSRDFAQRAMSQTLEALLSPEGTLPTGTTNAVLAAVDGVRPNDEIEAMLAGQMTVTHTLAMKFLGRANRAEHLEQLDASGALAVKLLRTFTAQVEALAKLRRGGEQTVRVEHVHIHAGGQAVVGNVSHRGGGGENETGEQPRATEHPRALTFTPSTPVRSADAERDGVPVARSEEQAPLPNARRRKR